MAEVKSLTLWEMCCWTYKAQRTHIYLKKGGQAFEWAMAASEATEDGPRPKVHWDAAMLHAEVSNIRDGDRESDIPERRVPRPAFAEAIVWAASNATRPALPTVPPRCFPVRLDGSLTRRPVRDSGGADEPGEIPHNPSKTRPALERNGRGRYHGERIEVLIKTLGFSASTRPLYQKRGRGNKLVKVGTEPYWQPIEWCPLRWMPDPSEYALTIEAYKIWRAAMVLLWDLMQDADLRDHRLDPEPIPEAPDAVYFDLGATMREFDPLDVTIEKSKRGEIVAHVFDDGGDAGLVEMLAERRLRAKVGR